MTPEGRAGLSISGFGKPIKVKPAPTNQLVPFVSSANPIGITERELGLVFLLPPCWRLCRVFPVAN
jgi:hypothetical protein